MKLKKLLAAVTAAALAVTTMAVTSFTASADDGPIYSVTLSATNGSTANIPIADVNMDNVSKVVVSFASETAINGGGGYMSGDDWTNAAGMFSCAANGTSDWEIDVSSVKPTGGIQIQLWYIAGEGTISITSVEFQDSDGSAVNTISSPFSTTIAKTETGSTSVEAIATVDYTKVATVEVDVESSTKKGTSAKVGINQNAEGNWKDSGDISVSDGTDPWTKTWSVTGLNGCVPSSLQVDFYSIDVGQVLSVNAIRFIDGEGNVLHSVPGGAAPAPGEVSVTVTPATASVKAGETVQLIADVTGNDDAVVTWTSTNTDVATVNASGLVTGVAEGSCEIRALVDGEFLGTPTSFSVVTVTEESGTTPPAAESIVYFEGESDALIGTEGNSLMIYDKMDKGLKAGDVLKVTYTSNEDTYQKIAPKAGNWTSLPSVDGEGDGGDGWITVASGNSTYTLTLSAEDAEKIDTTGLVFQGHNITITKVEIIPKKDSGTPVNPPADTETLWEGSMAIGWNGDPDAGPVNMLMIGSDKFANITAGGSLKFTFTGTGAAPQLKFMDGDWEELASVKSDPNYTTYGTIALSGTSFSFTISAADAAALKAKGFIAGGQECTVTKVEYIPEQGGNTPTPTPTPDDPAHTHTPATTWSSDATGHWYACSGCTDKVEFAPHTSDNGTVTTPATATTAGTRTYKCTVCGYVIRTETIPATGSAAEPVYPPYYVGAPVIPTTGVKDGNAPTINGQNGWEAVTAEIAAASDGDKLVVDMNGATKVPSSVFKAVKDKDVDLVLNLSNGIKWTINGLSVTSTKAIDFDVTKNTKHIPNEVVDKAEGSHKRQISLDHNGSFGCNAVMTYDVGTQYNGLYANLFYYNRKAKELELIDCSPISGGKANFLFTHASDYLITISAEPLGDYEDVSSAAGITSDNNSGVNSIAFCSVLAVITLAFGFVVYKKRRHN